MDPLDKFNNIVLNLSVSWKYVFYFVAGVYILATILFLAEGHRWGLTIISWIILAVVAVAITFVLKEKDNSPPEKTEDQYGRPI